MLEYFFDSSALFAWGDPTGSAGKKIEAFLLERQPSAVTTNLVFAEVISLATKRVGKFKGLTLGEKILSSHFIQLIHIDEPLQKEAWQLYKKYKDKDFDLIDASSFVICKKRGIKEIFTLDHHFSQMGFKILL